MEKLNEAVGRVAEIIYDELMDWVADDDPTYQKLDKLTELLDRVTWTTKNLKDKDDV